MLSGYPRNSALFQDGMSREIRKKHGLENMQ